MLAARELSCAARPFSCEQRERYRVQGCTFSSCEQHEHYRAQAQARTFTVASCEQSEHTSKRVQVIARQNLTGHKLESALS